MGIFFPAKDGALILIPVWKMRLMPRQPRRRAQVSSDRISRSRLELGPVRLIILPANLKHFFDWPTQLCSKRHPVFLCFL